MEWIERLNKTISYIEEHLTEEISYDELAWHSSFYGEKRGNTYEIFSPDQF